MTALIATAGGTYVAAAYCVFLAIVVIYLAIMASKLVRIEREVTALDELTDRGGK